MVVDFVLRKTPLVRTLSRTWKGPWKDRRIRDEFEKLEKGMRGAGIRTGRWFFVGDYERSRYLVAIEARGRLRPVEGARAKTFPKGRIAAVEFDPQSVSPRVIYHGLSDWLRWRKKDKTIQSAGAYREVYPSNPWKDRTAESRTQVQVVVR
ncbi:MAG TPA: GyrI-like domain-containing protein [Thermoplasmata archaeon]|nr:GyrI-like domain-containing protein [Thermoplasmata archaeon]